MAPLRTYTGHDSATSSVHFCRSWVYCDRGYSDGNRIDTRRVEAVDPPLPEAAYRLINPLVEALLRSPLHVLVSDVLLILTYKSKKSGTVYTTPVGYERRGNALVVTSSYDGVWWTNLRGSQPVFVRLQGTRRRGVAEVTEDPAGIAAYLDEFVEREGTNRTERVGI